MNNESTIQQAQSLLGDMNASTNHTRDSTPATSKQVEEMMSVLRDIASKNNASAVSSLSLPSAALSTSTDPPTNSSSAYQNVRNRLPPLPVIFHPIRKWVSTHRQMTFCLVIVATVILLSGASNYSNERPLRLQESASTNSNGIMSSFSLGGTKDKTLYYNTRPGMEDNLRPLSRATYPDGGSVICILVSNNDKDVRDLTVALRSLVFLRGDSDLLSPVLVFNEGDLSEEQITTIRTSTSRPIAFPIVNLMEFPPGFDPEDYDKSTHFDVKDRKPWGYYQMIRFFVTLLWDHPAIERYETVMRMDSDSCFKEPNFYLPNMMHEHVVYHSQYVGVEPEAGKPYIEGLFDFMVEYMDRVGKSPGNVMLWHFIESMWTSKGTLPVFRTNLEVSKKSYMQRADVAKWHRTLTEEEPFGLLRYRWGDAITRFLEGAVFCTDDTLLTIRMDGYYHKQGCELEEVERAIAEHNL